MENLKELRDYCDKYFEVDFETGKIWRKKYKPGITFSEEAGCVRTDGYRIITVRYGRYFAHRLLWFLYYGYFPENDLDHIDGDRLNNSIKNLREVSRGCNLQNQKESKNNTSGFTGVSLDKKAKKYQALIRIRGKLINLGCYPTNLEAAYARAAFEVLSPDWTCNAQGTIFKQIAKVDKTFDFERFENDVKTYGFEFSTRRYPLYDNKT